MREKPFNHGSLEGATCKTEISQSGVKSHYQWAAPVEVTRRVLWEVSDGPCSYLRQSPISLLSELDPPTFLPHG